jgi:hypothetical protein
MDPQGCLQFLVGTGLAALTLALAGLVALIA